ncbi:TetR/AcrR family transcriptional regulator [Saccharopolyspora elongata]|uniref:TetR/AcrR family transcriptional regulator n=1 Tax=Saccharopolyspora elongata TaxID=2530387 RepID=A0A4R4XUA3_9PSEU|nr:TetR/AcrR family transcriptional regulator [Saccharopolyspora elongata]TDD34935.1 TetR/AcrR family transcriptional regulator [Saccharopolyspora elongata]
MAVAFTEEERERIAERLLDAAEQLFAAQGLKKTSLEELSAAAGIAKGSFYAFFDSKETLYKEVMIRRAPLIGRQLASVLGQPVSVQVIAALLRQMTTVLTTDPFYRRLLTHPDELRAVSRRVGSAEVARVAPHVVTPLLEYIAKGQRDGRIVDDVEPEVVLGVLRTAGLIVMNRELFGDASDQVLDATIDALARGLVVSEGKQA